MTDFRGYCWICGDPAEGSARWWDADDGWKVTRLCKPCRKHTAKARPQPVDYALHARGIEALAEYVHDEEEAIDAIFG